MVGGVLPEPKFILYYVLYRKWCRGFPQKKQKQKTKMCHEQVLLTPPCLMGFSLHQCIIHGSLVRHSWEPHVNPARTSMGTLHVHVHGNLTPHHYLAPLAIFLCWAFLFFLFFSRIFVCGPFRLSLSPLGRDHEHITTFAAHHHGLWYHLLCRAFFPTGNSVNSHV